MVRSQAESGAEDIKFGSGGDILRLDNKSRERRLRLPTDGFFLSLFCSDSKPDPVKN